MEFISLSFVKDQVLRQYGKHKNLKGKIEHFFNSFVNTHNDLEYFWVDNKIFLKESYGFYLKKEIERVLNKPIKPIRAKLFSKEEIPAPKDANYVTNKLKERKDFLEKKEAERRASILDEFNDTIRSIKNSKSGFRHIGVFDLEFWEMKMNILLEFGWVIMDYQGETKTTHLIVQDNLKYNNGVYSKNNKYARRDSKTIPLSIALEEFQKEFLDKVEIVIGHGLTNDFKVLKANGLDLNIKYLDTAQIGAAFMDVEHTVSLERLLDYLKIEHNDLHNAANDVEYILEAVKTMGNL